MNAAKTWIVPSGYRALADIVQEYGYDHSQTKLMSGQWPAFKLVLYTGHLTRIPPTTWCVTRGREWLEDGESEFEDRREGRRKIEIIRYAVIVRVSEQQPRRRRKTPQGDRIDQAIAKRFPSGTDGISTKAVHKAVAEELAPDSKKRGLAIPSETTVKRRLGRRK